jgi:hypothetical protein
LGVFVFRYIRKLKCFPGNYEEQMVVEGGKKSNVEIYES